MLIDQIQITMAHDRLPLCVHRYDVRLEMKPSLVQEIFVIRKTQEGGLYFWDTL